MTLSEARAASVISYLVGTGLTRDALVSKGYGETTPIADNTTQEGRWKNRRIGFTVLENE
jgi:outer membrane protein OmpA-like peptidoglycan-associated protein